MSSDRVFLCRTDADRFCIGPYQIVTDYGSLRLTPIGALRLRRLLDKELPPDDVLRADDDPSEGMVRGEIV